jgi:lipid II:glycine glycyltransferase (peptidoglycan interpeptide bridge formation enzyme)
LWRAPDEPVAAAQLLTRPIPRTPWRFSYVSKGPALNYADSDLANQILGDLEHHAKTAQALFIKIDPDVPRQYGDPTEGPGEAEATGQATVDLLSRRGWHFSAEQIQFRNTIVMDVGAEEAELLARMKAKWRYNIRLAGRREVVVRTGSTSDLAEFYRMYAQTARRDGFLIRPAAYYLDLWHHFLAASQAELLLAEVEGQPVAGLILFYFGQKAWYMYGASTGQHRNLMPNHLLQWQAICRAKSLGCQTYDMWGAPESFEPSDRMWGVYRFKRGFGGRVVQGLGAFDYPVQPALYGLFATAMPHLRSLLRRIGRAEER